MIRHYVEILYINLSQKWSTAKVKALTDYIVLNKKSFISFVENCHCNTFDFVFQTYIQKRIDYLITSLLKLSIYLNKFHDWYLTITYCR